MSLDPLANRIRREVEKRDESQPPKLNPDFPYNRWISIDLREFGADEEPPPRKPEGDS